MKNLFAFLLFVGLFFAVSNSSFAQESYGGALNAFVKFGDNSSISGYYEFEVAPSLTVSPEVLISFGDDSWIGLGGRVDYYFDTLINLTEPWDIWAGVDAGFILSGNESFNLNLHAGVEYKFSDMWGILAEFGGGKIASGGLGVGIHF